MELPKVPNTLKRLRENPEMYWGTKYPTSNLLVGFLVKQLLTLGIEDIQISKIRCWFVVGSSEDWFVSGTTGENTIQSLFEKGRGFPEEGTGGAVRCELHVYSLAEDIVAFHKNEFINIKNTTNSQAPLQEIKGNSNASTLVAFRGNTYV